MSEIKIYRKYALYFALFLTLLASAYFRYQDSQNGVKNVIVEATFGTNKVLENADTDITSSVEIRSNGLAKVDIFEAYKKPTPEPEVVMVQKKILEPAPVVTALLPSPPAPTAPPVPFKYIGKILGDDEYQVFVGFNEKNLVLKEGDIIQQTYKIEKIAPPVMTMTYIPMNILQDMLIGEIN